LPWPTSMPRSAYVFSTLPLLCYRLDAPYSFPPKTSHVSCSTDTDLVVRVCGCRSR
jgi:hypothetical protein